MNKIPMGAALIRLIQGAQCTADCQSSNQFINKLASIKTITIQCFVLSIHQVVLFK